MAIRDVLLFFLLTATLKERHQVDGDPLQERLDIEKDFLQPELLSNLKIQFVYKHNIIFIFTSNELNWNEARSYCQSSFWNGILAIVDDEDKVEFLSEALTETRESFDNLWIAGTRDVYGNWSTSYLSNNNVQYLPSSLIEKYNGTKNRLVTPIKRDCLSFRRTYNKTGSFIDLHCSGQRPFICQTTYNNTQSNMTSTHPSWFQIGDKHYKIFYDEVSWANATINCDKMNAKLAYVANYSDARVLSRHMLIGRPSLENAWIGAKWNFDDESYEFEGENVKLDNATDKETNYPPWSSTVIKTGGCLLLDRHLQTKTLFVPARCQRLRPYICYKTTSNLQIGDNNTFIFPHGDYKLYFNPLRFDEAVAMCTYPINGNFGVIAQPKNFSVMQDLMFAMGEAVTYVNHIWIGGKHFKDRWMWLKAKENASEPQEGDEYIPLTNVEGYPPWVENSSYTEEVENMNLCLNMDRENHVDALFYGADCYYAQSFFCKYPQGTFETTTVSPTATITTPLVPTTETKDFPDLTILPVKPDEWEAENSSSQT